MSIVLKKYKKIGWGGANVAMSVASIPMTFVNKKLETVQSVALKHAGKYAWSRFTTAQFARDYANLIPLMIVSSLIRMIVNWLLYYRLRTGITLADFCLSVAISIFTSIISPFFYAIADTKKDDFMSVTNKIMDHLFGIQPSESGLSGWEYFFAIRNKIIIITAGGSLIWLQFVEVTSRDIQFMIIHILVSSWVVDVYKQWLENAYKPKWIDLDKFATYQGSRRLTSANYISCRPSPIVITDVRSAKPILRIKGETGARSQAYYMHTASRQRAKKINAHNIRQTNIADTQQINTFQNVNKSKIVNIQTLQVFVDDRIIPTYEPRRHEAKSRVIELHHPLVRKKKKKGWLRTIKGFL